MNIDVQILTAKLDRITGDYSKMETLITRVTDLATCINNIVTQHEERIATLTDKIQSEEHQKEKEQEKSEVFFEKFENKLDEKIDDMEENLKQEFDKLKMELKSMNQRVSKLEVLRWKLVGGIVLLSFLFTNADTILKALSSFVK